jgi:hypothetical protein
VRVVEEGKRPSSIELSGVKLLRFLLLLLADAFWSRQAFQSKREDASFRYAFTSTFFGTTAIRVAVSPSGLEIR